MNVRQYVRGRQYRHVWKGDVMAVKTGNKQFSEFVMTDHAGLRMQQRGLTMQNIEQVISYGRCIHAPSSVTFFVGRKEVERMMAVGVDLRDCKNLHVVGVLENNQFVVVTMFKNETLQRRPGERGCKGGGLSCTSVFTS
jgi:hypothetical protein